MLPKHEIVDPKTKLLNVCCASLVGRPQYYSSTDDTRGKLVAAADAVCEQDPEFLLKTALYVRDDLNIRSTANFLLALAASKPEARSYLKKYFVKAVRLPTDLTEVVEMYQSLAAEEGEDRVPMPTCLRKAVKQKLGGFSLHTIGKYQNKAGKKPKAAQAKGAVRGRSGRQGYRQRVCASLGGMQLDHDQEAEALKTKRVSVDLKQLVRLTHTSEPKQMVMSLLGKRYPVDETEFARSGLTGEFDANMCGKRMKIPVPTTWETQVSAHGNNAQTWERLVAERQLPFMAMLRNLRNMLTCKSEVEGTCGVSLETHREVLSRLMSEQQVAASRQFPFRFLSAYEVVCELSGEGSLAHAGDQYGMGYGMTSRRGHGRDRGSVEDESRLTPCADLLAEYKAALETAIRIATTRNVKPIRGKSVVFVDVSGSMQCAVSGGGTGMGSIRSCADVSILLGLMLKYVCQECELRIFSSPGSHGKCHLPVELEEEGILANFARVKQARSRLGGGTDFPFDYLEEFIQTATGATGAATGGGAADPAIDNFFIISDMMIAPGRQEMSSGGYRASSGSQSTRAEGVSGVLRQFREKVNPDLLFVTVDLHGSGRSQVQLEDGAAGAHPNDVLVTGYSDEILRYVVERKGAQVDYVEGIDEEKGLAASASADVA